MKGLSRLECGKSLDDFLDEELVERLRHCASHADLDDCDTCPGGDFVQDYTCPDIMMQAAADRIERLSRRLDETAGIALKLQERLDRIYGLAERELSLTLEGLLDGSADQMD